MGVIHVGGRKWLKKWMKTKANPQMGVMGGGGVIEGGCYRGDHCTTLYV